MSGHIVCKWGMWEISGQCLSVGKSSRSVGAVQMSLQFGISEFGGGIDGGSGEGSAKVDLAWAQGHKEEILEAVAVSLGYDKSLVQIEFVSVEAAADLGARRLEAPGAFEMRVTVLVGEETTVDIAEALLARLVAAPVQGSGAVSFVSALGTRLVARGEPVPAGLAVVSASPPSVLAEFFAAVSDWFSDKWNPCSAACGTGSRNRTVQCPGGLDALCDPGARPEEEEICSSHDACDFKLLCPMGPDAMSCSAQAGGLVATAVAIALCAACCVCMRVCRSRDRGTITLRTEGSNLTVQSSFRIYRPTELTRRNSIASAMSRKSSVGSALSVKEEAELAEVAEKTKDGKTHIVWDAENQQLKEFFGEMGTELNFGQEVTTPTMKRTPSGGMPRISSASRSRENLGTLQLPRRGSFGSLSLTDGSPAQMMGSERTRASADGDDSVFNADFELQIDELLGYYDDFVEQGGSLEEGLRFMPRFGPTVCSTKAAYDDGARVEYYSQTLGKWVVGTMRVVESVTGKAARSFRYDVALERGQARVKVGLDHLRLPIQPGEVVEVFLRRGWQPGSLVKGSLNSGYSVQLDGNRDDGDGDGALLENLHAHRLRRRFEVGEVVWVYNCGASGWLRGKVEEQLCEEGLAGEDGLQLPHIKSVRSVASAVLSEIAGLGSMSSLATLASSASAASLASPTARGAMGTSSPGGGGASPGTCRNAGRSRWSLYLVRLERCSGSRDTGADADEFDRVCESVPAYLIRSMQEFGL